MYLSVFKSLAEWYTWYHNIVDQLNIDISSDIFATRYLDMLIKGKVYTPYTVLSYIKKNTSTVIVFGAGPSLPKVLDALRRLDLESRCLLLSADGATKALLEHGLTPHVVVTDLDGFPEAIYEAALRDAVLFVHGHGDNIDKLSNQVPQLTKVTKLIVGTSQVLEYGDVVLMTGFTDGDRATVLAYTLGYRRIVLVGMDFGNIVGRYSKPYLETDTVADVRKRIKLSIAENIISYIACTLDVELYSLSSYTPRCVKRISIEELARIL